MFYITWPERSAEIFKHLKEEEIEQLTLEIANIRTVTPEEKKVMEEFTRSALPRSTLPRRYQLCKGNPREGAGNAKALDVINKLTVSLQVGRSNSSGKPILPSF